MIEKAGFDAGKQYEMRDSLVRHRHKWRIWYNTTWKPFVEKLDKPERYKTQLLQKNLVFENQIDRVVGDFESLGRYVVVSGELMYLCGRTDLLWDLVKDIGLHNQNTPVNCTWVRYF